MTSRSVEVAGVSINIEEHGTGLDVVLLHGFTGSAGTMAELGSGLSRRQMRLDLVGHGDSSAPATLDEYTMEAMVSQVASVIEAAADGPIDIVGYSLGGRVALSLLIARPELVRRASLIGASPGLRSAAGRDERVIGDEALAASIVDDGLAQFVDSWMALPMWSSLRAARTPDWWEQSRQQRLSSSPVGLANSLRGAGTGAMAPLFNRLGDIATPVQLVIGELDKKFLAIGRSMHSDIADSVMTVIEGAGHAAHLERPVDAQVAIAGFLR